MDITIKVKEIDENLQIYPVSFQISFNDKLDGGRSKTRRFKMIPYTTFYSD